MTVLKGNSISLASYSAHLLLRCCMWAPAIHIAIPPTTLLQGKQALDFLFYQRKNCSMRTGIHGNNLTYLTETGGCSAHNGALVFGSYVQSMDFRGEEPCGSEQVVSGPCTEDGTTLAQRWPVSGVEVSSLRVWNQDSGEDIII